MKALSLQPPCHWGPFRKALNLVLVASLTLGAVTLPEAWATDYYVNSTTGSDANGGSSAAPWKTLTYALDTSASGVTSGDVIHVAPGLYDTLGNNETFPLALADGVAIIGDTTTPANCIVSAPLGKNAFYNDDGTSPTGLSESTRLAGLTLKHDGSTDSGLVKFDVGSQSMAPQIDHVAFAGASKHDDGIVYYDVSGAPGTFTPTIDKNTFTNLDEGVILKALGQGTNQVFSPTITNNTFTSCRFPVNYTMATSAEGTVGGLVQGNTFRTTVYDDVYVDFDPNDGTGGLLFNPTITGNDMQSGAGSNVYVGLYGYSYSGDATFSPMITGNTMEATSDNFNMTGYYASILGDYTVSPTISGNTMSGFSDKGVGLSLTTLSVSTSSKRNVISPTVTNNSITGSGANSGVEISLSEWNGGQIAGTATVADNAISGVDDGIHWSMSEMYYGTGMNWSIDLSNNTITSPTDTGILFEMESMSYSSSAASTFNLTVEGNTVTGAGSTGMSISPAEEWNGNNAVKETALIRGNTVTGSGGAGLRLWFTEQTNNTLDARVTDNVIEGNAGNGMYIFSDKLGSNGIQVSCNTITGNTGNGVIEANSAAYMDPPADYGGGNLSSPGNNEIHGNGDGSTTFDFNNQRGQGSGLVEASAQHNWWGSASGPGAGQTSGPVDTSSYLTVAPGVILNAELTAADVNDVAPPGNTVGDTFEYTATITPAASSCGDTSLTFTVPIPANASLVPDSATTTRGTITNTDPLTVSLGSVSNGETITITWKVIPSSGTTMQSQGTLSAAKSGNTLSDDPATAAANDPTVTALVSPQPGSVRFAQASYTVGEGDGSVTLDVMRSGGSDGAISVSYATHEGSAEVPSDYAATSGTLNWADGDATIRHIVVPIVDDAIPEGDETFTVTLTDPPGAAVVVAPETATVTIKENKSVTAIPTLGGSALLALSTLLLLLGVALLRRRRRLRAPS